MKTVIKTILTILLVLALTFLDLWSTKLVVEGDYPLWFKIWFLKD